MLKSFQRYGRVFFAGFLVMLSFAGGVVAAQAADPFTLQNRWTGAFLQEQGQSVGLAESADAAGTRWRALQAPDNHFYLQSESGNYLHVVNGQLVVGQATMDDIGAHWNARQSEDGTLNISNRRGDNLYLNIENGPPAVSQIQPGWWSAMWRMQNAPQPDPNAQASQNSGNENPQRDADASNPDVNAPTQYVFWSEAQRGYLQVGANSALTFANDPTEAGTNWMLEDGPGGFYNLRSEQGTLLYIANGRVGAGYGETTNPAVQWIFDALGDSKYLFSTSAAPQTLLFVQNGVLQAGQVSRDDISAHWTVYSADQFSADDAVAQGVTPPTAGSVTLQMTNSLAREVSLYKVINADTGNPQPQYIGDIGAGLTLPVGAEPGQTIICGVDGEHVGDPYEVGNQATQYVNLPYAEPLEETSQGETRELTPDEVKIAADRVVTAIVKKQLDEHNRPRACWRDTVPRGVGTIPECGPDQVKNGLLCYPKCEADPRAARGIKYTNVAGVCWQQCPAGYRDDGAFCRKENYSRRGDVIKHGLLKYKAEAAMKRCEDMVWARRDIPGFEYVKQRGRGNNCEDYPIRSFPKCRPGYHAAPGAPAICLPNERDCEAVGLGGKFLGSCAKKSFVVLPEKGGCARRDVRGNIVLPGQPGFNNAIRYENAGGLCYKNCDTAYYESTGKRALGKFTGVGPVCWAQCPAGMVNCGGSCAKDTRSCKMTIVDQTTSPLISAGSIALTVVTAGTAAGATAAAKTAAAAGKTATKAATQAAVRASAKASLRKSVKAAIARKFAQGTFARALVKEAAIDTAINTVMAPSMWAIFDAVGKKKARKAVREAVIRKLQDDNFDDAAIDSVLELAMKGVEEKSPASEFPWESLDPSGIAEVVVAYNMPMCSSIK